MPLKSSEIVEQVVDRNLRSHDWMNANFYGQWEQVYKNYKCEKVKYKDDVTGKDDDERFAICLPDTLIAVRRFVARVTAQPPLIGYRGEDHEISRGVSRKLMYDWDKGRMQRVWKKNVTQCALFGWSMIGFHWAVEEFERRRKIDISRPMKPEDLEALQKQYAIQMVPSPSGMVPDPLQMMQLKANHGGSSMVKIARMYRSFVGAKGSFVFVGDCFPEPEFEELQDSNWFIIQRRRNRDWLTRMAEAIPEMREGVLALFAKHPNGTLPTNASTTSKTTHFRDRLRAAINRISSYTSDSQKPTTDTAAEWTITEQHCPGGNLTLVAEDTILLGDLPYPYDLDGKIAFSDTTYIPDIISGVGDSTARLMTPLADAHNRMFENRLNLADKVTRPLLGTTSKRIYDNPDLIKRGKGLRLVLLDSANDLVYPQEQAALAAMQAGMAEDGMLERNIQKATGESNLSMGANVDPAQLRTATGSRIMQANLDVLSKSDITNISDSGVRGAVEIMFLMNASELPESIQLDPTEYDARYGEQSQQLWMAAHPYQFQGEGSLYVEAGSTLADDDEANNQRAMNLWGMSMQRPDIIDPRYAAERVIESFGERNRMNKWILQPQPPPPPEPPKASVSFSVKAETLSPDIVGGVLEKANLIAPGQNPFPPQPPPGMMPGGGPMPPMGPDGAPMMPPPQLPPQ